MTDEKHQDEIREIREEKDAEMDITKGVENALEFPSIPKAEDIDARLRQSRRERDAARRDVHKAIITGRDLGQRVEMLERAILNPLKKGWRHPIAGNAFSNYHRCKACGGEFEDEVVMVVHRTRSGDHYYVFCNKECLANYNDW
jgi:hypothetical protein